MMAPQPAKLAANLGRPMHQRPKLKLRRRRRRRRSVVKRGVQPTTSWPTRATRPNRGAGRAREAAGPPRRGTSCAAAVGLCLMPAWPEARRRRWLRWAARSSGTACGVWTCPARLPRSCRPAPFALASRSSSAHRSAVTSFAWLVPCGTCRRPRVRPNARCAARSCAWTTCGRCGWNSNTCPTRRTTTRVCPSRWCAERECTT
mmetsp:Transcript_50750/g.121271  ORF Transcript_50750/g.121271 Transcript_50750/m.121271 type:complete len:203 (-) Transcript_50750:801-1409(-)